MIKLKMKNYNMILIEKLQKYQSAFHQIKLISTDILLVMKYCLPKLLKNKEKQLMIKGKNKQKQLKNKKKKS